MKTLSEVFGHLWVCTEEPHRSSLYVHVNDYSYQIDSVSGPFREGTDARVKRDELAAGCFKNIPIGPTASDIAGFEHQPP